MKKTMLHHIGSVMAVLLLMATSPSYAYEDQVLPPQFNNIFLPYDANSVNCILQDEQGLMWFGTRRGVFAYNGFNTRKIADGNFHAIIKVTDDILCLGGDGGLYWMNIKTEQFESPFPDVPATGEVRTLAYYDDVLYVGTHSRGLFTFDVKRKIWHRFILPCGRSEIIFAIIKVGKDVYVGHHNGLAVLNSNGKFRDIKIDDTVYSMWCQQSQKRLWIGTEHGLSTYDLEDGSVGSVLQDGTVNQVVMSPKGNLLLASETGLKILDLNTYAIRTISHDASNPAVALPNNTIHQILCDKSNNVWIATDNGVAHVSLINPFYIQSLPSIAKSNEGNRFTQMLIDSRGERWMGGDNGLLHTDNTGKTKWFSVGHGLRKNTIRHIYEDRDKEIWIATDASIAFFNRKINSFQYVTLHDEQGRNANWAYDIYEDAYSRLWIATYMGGLYVVDKKTLLACNGEYVVKRSPFTNMDDIVNTIYSFMPDSNGILWANTCRGLASIDTKTMKVSLKQDTYLDKMIFAEGSLWIDEQGKLFRYDINSEKKEKLEFDLNGGTIYSFCSQPGRVWLSTSEGIYYISTTNGQIYNYGKLDKAFTTGVFNSVKNEILWGGEDFICTQKLNKDVEYKKNHVYVTGIIVDGNYIKGESPRFTNRINIPVQEDVTLELSSFMYDGITTPTFWYKLGEKGEWHYLQPGKNSLSFAKLSSGSTTLFLTYDNPNITEDVTIYTLSVPYPWYMRWWAWVFYIAICSILCYTVFRQFQRRNRRIMEQHERERTLALTQQKMDFFVDMSHELKTPLSLIIAPLSHLLSETTNAQLRSKLKGIHNNAIKLNDLIHHILDFKQLEIESEDAVLLTWVNFKDLINECVEEFTSIAEERNIQIDKIIPDGPIWLNIDAVKIKVVIGNLISNAVKYVNREQGLISLKVVRNDNQVVVTIGDNGIGVPPSDIDKIFNRYYRGQNATSDSSGIGLSIVKKYITMHHGEVKAYNSNGLMVTFTIPIENADIVENKKESINAELPTILIVDDNTEILDFLTTSLQKNYNCVTANSGVMALDVIAQTVPDLIITDQMMPNMDGSEFVKRLRHEHSTKTIPIIMLTAKDDSNTELESIRIGVDVFLPKPFDLRKLQLHIVQLLNKQKALLESTNIADMLKENSTKDSAEYHKTLMTSDEELMHALLNAIEKNMKNNDFNVNALAQTVGVDSKQLYRKLKQMTGMTPVAFLRQKRMQRAALLLKQNRFTISEVVYQVGYTNASYFTKAFEAEYGISPKEYINK